MTSDDTVYSTVDVGYMSVYRPGMVYVGTLTAKGEIPAITTLQRRDVYQVMVLGRNELNSNHHCMLVTLDHETGSITYEVIQCPISKSVGCTPATRVGDTVYVFGGLDNADNLYAYSIEHKTWEKVEKRREWPKKRCDHSAFCLGGTLYIAGGSSGYKSCLNDCWCYDPETGVWTQQADAPMEFGGSATVVVGDVVHFIGSYRNRYMHLTFSLSRGWRRERDIPFECAVAGGVCVGRYIHILCGSHTKVEVHVYNTQTKQWRQGKDLPSDLPEYLSVGPHEVLAETCRACLIRPRTLLVCSGLGMMVGDVPLTHQERREKERLEREERERLETERQSLVTSLLSLGVSADALPPSP
ncbi:hypothetical protein KIPB_011597, partial [Kipferlia bialata]|eukprot:g11597.t1